MKKLKPIIFIIVVLGLFTFFAMGSTSDDASVSAGNDSISSSSTENDTSEEEQKLTVDVGEVLTTDSLKITYEECVEITSYSDYKEPASGNTVYRLKMTVENISDSDEYISNYSFNCYADNIAAEVYLFGDDTLSATVSSGRTAAGYIYFEVPQNAENIEVEYETDFWSSEKAVFVVK